MLYFRCHALTAFLVVLLSDPASSQLPPPPIEQALPNDALIALGRNDASLHDMAVVSEDRLVAVGDRGVILISSNSGRSWEPSQSPTTSNLRSVRFSPQGFGLIVGGWIGSNTSTSHATVLHSLTGGKTWTVVATPDLPRLIGLQIEGDRCIAWGDYSPKWRTSVFESVDGGLTWHGTAATLGHATAAGISAKGQFVAIDQLGRSHFGTIAASESAAVHEKSFSNIAQSDKPIQAVHHTGQRWLACGAQGELIVSSDAREWTDVQIPLSPAARDLCQWRGIEQIGDHVWVCGSPGSIVLHSGDRGLNWTVARTGQTLPLTSIRFVDQNRGWATGPLGLILATRDGGQTWYAQRQRERRVGLYALVESAAAIPWSPLVAAAWDEQVAVAASVYQSPRPIEEAGFLPTHDAARSDKAKQIGLAECKIVSRSNATPQRFLEQAAVDLLSWRPDVLLLCPVVATPAATLGSASGRTSDELANLALAVLKLCAAPDSLLIDELQLPPWNVSKLVETCHEESSQFSEQSARVLRQPGIAIWDCLLPLSPQDRLSSQSVSMRTLWVHSQSRAAYASLLGAIAPSSETERQVAVRNIGNLQLIMGRVHRNQSLGRLAQAPTANKPLDEWLSDFDFLLHAVPTRETVPLLQQLVEDLSLTTQWEKRRAVYSRLISHAANSDNSNRVTVDSVAADSDAADWGQLELLRLEHSDERGAWERVARRTEQSALLVTDQSSQPGPKPTDQLSTSSARVATWNASPFGDTPRQSTTVSPSSMVVQATAERPLEVTNVQGDANRTLAKLAEWQHLLQATSPQSQPYLSRPDVQLLRYSAQRRSHDPSTDIASSLSQLNELARTTQLIGWPQMAAQELSLATEQVEKLRWKVTAANAMQPPLLDAVLDDPCWNHAQLMLLTALDDPRAPSTSVGQVGPTTIRWAYDANYLYVAIVSPHQSGSGPPPLVLRRGYDADLSRCDHVQLLLDTDRDYCTAIELAVSADGRTYDRCCGTTTYNPKWHVSVRSSNTEWTAELAIGLDQLTQFNNSPPSAWAVSARRLHPTGVSQSWSQLRSHQPYLHASGLLLFEP